MCASCVLSWISAAHAVRVLELLQNDVGFALLKNQLVSHSQRESITMHMFRCFCIAFGG